jgi:Tol biopolymer transport system component
LAYATSRGMAADICRLQLGGVPKSFIVSSRFDSNPAFSPDGRKIAFESDRAGETIDIWICDADGSNPVQLTHEDGAAGTPHWSPDGRLIVFDLFLSDGSNALYAVNAAGGHPRRLTPREIEAAMGCWSPDGKWICFTSNRSGQREIWQMPATGGEARQITQHGAENSQVSIDGKTIYFTKETSPGSREFELFAVPSAGGEARELADSVTYHTFTVTRDGIYYIRPGQDGGPSELCLLDPSTKKSRVLSVLEDTINEGLTVSPDGKTILYSRRQDLDTDLMLVENFR